MFTVVQRDSPAFHVVPTASCPVTGHPLKKAWLHPPCTLHSGIYKKIPPDSSVLQHERSQVSQSFLICEMVQSFNHFHGPVLDALSYVYVSLVLGEPRTRPSIPGAASSGLSRGEGSPPSSGLKHFCSCSPEYHSPCKCMLLAHIQVGVHQVLFCIAAFQPVSPSICWCLGFFLLSWVRPGQG